MKKFLAITLALLLVAFCFAGCKGENQTDLDYIKDKGTLVIGITNFAPMDYQEAGSDQWIGFDADMATAFAESLGVKVEFVEIEWDNKVMELDGKSIDCVWNGMTLGDEVKAAMECSKPYCNNAQIVIVPKDRAANYQTADACKNLKFAVEVGSAGKDMAAENKFNFTEVDSQAKALMEVAAGTSDAAIIDSLMAGAMVGEGTSYENLAYTVGLNSEEYGVGFRKGSNMAEELNKFFDETLSNGKMMEIANKYGVQAAIIK
ncbi:MAG: transporter substrate-binding domain-containing protein [Clostridiales bacterium]|nr:transporter substrate-binding domain-containing protein [Candidatus Equinaster intestinalis]